MGFKTDGSFLKFLTMGALGVHQTMQHLRDLGFQPIELERYCGSNKIWATKVKRLRLPDLLCVNSGLRMEVRAKTDLKIRMSDAPAKPDRIWDAGLRDEDVVAFIACVDTVGRPIPADTPVYFTVQALRTSVEQSKIGPPKSASEGAERDRTWPAIVPSRPGRVLEVTADKLVVEMHVDGERVTRRQTYNLSGKSAYVTPGDTFLPDVTILGGAPPALANLSRYLRRRYRPLEQIHAPNVVDRYAAVKALRYRDDPRAQVLPALEGVIAQEQEIRVKLEAAGSAASLGSAAGQDAILQHIWANPERPDMRMEATFVLTELRDGPFSRAQLRRIADSNAFAGDEIRQAAVWGLGKTGVRSYADLLPFIDDAEEDVALHAIAAFAEDTPITVIEALVRDLVTAHPRRAPAASEALRIIGSPNVLETLVTVARATTPPPKWVLATLGRLQPIAVRQAIAGSALLEQISPMLLLAEGAHWLATEDAATDIRFLLKQDVP
ncbi:MAG: hypothetical protein IJ131_07395 [Eggerthellaceae bacterium]|nr:hypothetical protein [Eggerthellaceae bacterium]